MGRTVPGKAIGRRDIALDYTHGYAIGFFSYIDRVLRDALVRGPALGVMA